MQAHNSISCLLQDRHIQPKTSSATAFAPVNIALIKYWGKRNTALNLPITNSLSVALPNKGTTTHIQLNTRHRDTYYLNNQLVDMDSEFARRLHKFCDLFRFEENYHFDIHTENNIPTAAGLASSASGFAAVTLAFDQLFDWKLEKSQLSILARLGSGSACRSLWTGLVEWEQGSREDGLDSYAHPLNIESKFMRAQDHIDHFLTQFCIGLLIFEQDKKIISSREAMLNTVKTSPSYTQWPQQVMHDLQEIKQAIADNNFVGMAEIAERNALAMHKTMFDSTPSTNYCTERTIAYREKIWALRKSGIPVYFTQDAGPNLKLLFPTQVEDKIHEIFPEIKETIYLI